MEYRRIPSPTGHNRHPQEMRELLIESVVVMFGVILGRFVYSSIFKVTSLAAQVSGWLAGLFLAIVFYLTWAHTGMDPMQHATCTLLPSTPKCVELLFKTSTSSSIRPNLAASAAERASDASPTVGQAVAPRQTSNASEVSSQPAPASQAQQCFDEYHEVQPGETLRSIANLYELNWQAVAENNSITDPDHLQSGWDLFLYESCE